MERISGDHPRHPKYRLDLFLGLMELILRALLKALHGDSKRADTEADRMVKAWVEDQGRDLDPGPAANLLDSLMRVMLSSSDGEFEKEYCLGFERQANAGGEANPRNCAEKGMEPRRGGAVPGSLQPPAQPG